MNPDDELRDTTKFEQSNFTNPTKNAPKAEPKEQPQPQSRPLNSTQKRTETLATVSLILGCISLFCGVFTALPAVICGHIARKKIKNDPKLGGDGVALAGLIMGYLFLTLILIYVVAIAAKFIAEV